MNTVKINNWDILTPKGRLLFAQITNDNPWGFILQTRNGDYSAQPNAQMSDSFRIQNWSFRYIDK